MLYSFTRKQSILHCQLTFFVRQVTFTETWLSNPLILCTSSFGDRKEKLGLVWVKFLSWILVPLVHDRERGLDRKAETEESFFMAHYFAKHIYLDACRLRLNFFHFISYTKKKLFSSSHLSGFPKRLREECKIIPGLMSFESLLTVFCSKVVLFFFQCLNHLVNLIYTAFAYYCAPLST